MKKIFTLLLGLGSLTAVFAQSGHHNYSNQSNFSNHSSYVNQPMYPIQNHERTIVNYDNHGYNEGHSFDKRDMKRDRFTGFYERKWQEQGFRFRMDKRRAW